MFIQVIGIMLGKTLLYMIYVLPDYRDYVRYDLLYMLYVHPGYRDYVRCGPVIFYIMHIQAICIMNDVPMLCTNCLCVWSAILIYI